jgi:CBS domain-containing protein
MKADQTGTPLFVLEAVVVDTETTGLDPASAMIIEIGAIAISGYGRSEETFETFVTIDGPLPDQARAVTGIHDSDLECAPRFPSAFQQLRTFCGERVVIGHSFGFDLAVFAGECRRHNVEQWHAVFLDTRYLAQLVIPNLPDYSLELLAGKLNVSITNRHRALADARLTAAVFTALLPLLRDRGIRTFGEAVTACKHFDNRSDYPKVWAPLAQGFTPEEGQEIIVPLDTFLFTTTVSSIMTSAPQFISPQATVSEAAKMMAQAKAGSLLVGEGGAMAQDLALVTERDVLGAIGSAEEHHLDWPVSSIASRPLQSVYAGAFMYRAIGRMARLGIRHLGVTDEVGRVTGVVSARDLLKSRMSEPVALADAIDNADSELELGQFWAKVPTVARSMLASGMDGREIAAIIAREIAALTRRSAILAERRMSREGAGEPPCPYAVLVLGSAGRGESLLAFDQDNAIVFETGAEGGPEDEWFGRLGKYMCETLHAVGVPLCKGGVMASNAAWRGSVTTWEQRATGWIDRSRPQDLLAVDIFYDFRPVHGAIPLAENLWQRVWKATEGKTNFLKLLADSAGEYSSPFGFFGNLQTQNGRIDLKLYGLKQVVTAARILALRNQVLERATALRYKGLISIGLDASGDLQLLIDAQRTFQTYILRQQLADIAIGKPAGNKAVVTQLTKQELSTLREALKRMELIGQILRDQLAS